MMVLPRRSFSDTSWPFSSGRVNSGALSLTFMPIPNKRSKLNVRNTGLWNDGRPTFWKILHRRVISRRATLFADDRNQMFPRLAKEARRGAPIVGSIALLIAVGACSATMVCAQEERPQIIPGERRAPKKKESGPRAVGVLQM